MKVRVKLTGAARAVEVGDGDECTLFQLLEKTAEAFQLQPESFSLSLNKSDALSDDKKTLAQIGIVPGDLIFVLSAESAACGTNDSNNASALETPSITSNSSSSVSSRASGKGDGIATELGMMETDDNNEVPSSSVAPSQTESDPALVSPSATRQGGTAAMDMETASSSVLSQQEAGASHPTAYPSHLDDPEVNRCLQEPLLCRESTPIAVPALLRDLFEGAQCRTEVDALWVVVHAIMMEVGFRPSQDDDPALMSAGWNQRGFYKQQYQHLFVQTLNSCTVIGVPMGSSLILHGVANGEQSKKTDNQQLKVVDFVQGPVTEHDVCSVYQNLEKLSLIVKDMVCQPLLSHLSEACGFPVSLGLLSLSFELKLKLMSYLPASSLVSMGQVCREYSMVFKDPCLWRRLYLREFGRKEDNSLNRDWYMLFKEEYLVRKERRRNSRHRHQILTGIPPWLNPPPGHFPPLAPPPFPAGIIGGEYDLNPEFMSTIPHPLFGRPGGPTNPFMPQAPGSFGGGFIPRPRFTDPFGPGGPPGAPPGGPGAPHFTTLGNSSLRHRPSPYGSRFC